jgi:hypothetical protein
MTKNKADIEFQIDQLRKDKIIYAVESVATSLAGLIIILVGITILPGLALLFTGVGTTLSLGCWLYMGLGNLKRLQQIKELERHL